jgi:uncharacterized protein (TIGR02172 family)
MARELHAKKADTSRFPSIKEMLRKFYLEKDLVSEEYKQRALDFLDKAPDADTCLHGDLHIGNVITDGQRNLWIDLGQFSYGVPEWDLGWMWTICNRMDGNRTDFLLHVTPETLTAHWNIFLATYLGTDDKATLGQYTKRLMSFYAVKLPYMYDLLIHGRLPEAAFHPLSQMIGI